MNTVNLFSYDSYKSYLLDIIQQNAGVKGYQTQMAKAAGCHGSYLSSVLHEKIQLTPDHAVGLKAFLGLNSLEFDFFFNLVLLERAVTQELRRELLARLSELRETKENLKKSLNAKGTRKDFEIRYYSQWYWAAIHMATYSPEFSTPESIARRLNLPLDKVKDVLNELAQARLVQEVKGKWTNHEDPWHLDRASTMNYTNHLNWRNKAMQDVEKENEKSLHYSSVMVISRKDAEKIKKKIVEMLSEQRQLIADSPSQELYAFSCDFFEV